jgi:16S rRNA (cytosine967-C5)-methyltransferase
MVSVSGREVSLRALVEYEVQNAPINLILDRQIGRFQNKMKPVEIAFATEVFYGVIRRLNTIDWLLSPFLRRPMSTLTPWIRNVLRSGTYQIIYLDKVPIRSAVDESVQLARKFGHVGTAGLVNAVLRKMPKTPVFPDPREEVCYLALYKSHPEWMVEKYLHRWGYEFTSSLLSANNTPAPTYLRVNTLKATPNEVRAKLKQEGIESSPGLYLEEALKTSGSSALVRSRAFSDGLFMIQDEASMLPARVLDPKPKETVLDVCSAPGSKSMHLAELMGDEGRVISADVNPNRLKLVSENKKRLGISSVEIICMDAKLAGNTIRQQVDRILVDAPCSGFGTIRRNPDLKWRRTQKDVETLRELQCDILEGVIGLLKPGGVMVYSTCTTEEEENEIQVRRLLERHPELDLDDPARLLPEGLRPATHDKMISTYPHINEIDGFFIARLIKH